MDTVTILVLVFTGLLFIYLLLKHRDPKKALKNTVADITNITAALSQLHLIVEALKEQLREMNKDEETEKKRKDDVHEHQHNDDASKHHDKDGDAKS